MAAWSGLLRSAGQILLRNNIQKASTTIKNGVIARSMSGHHTMSIVPSRWQWDKTKDLLHLYTLVAAIPLGTVIFLTNIFVGPAQLQPIPEGYEPKEWEYHRNPISRFFLRYVYTTDQQEYEKYCHFIWAEQEVMKLRALEKKVKDVMADRKDYQAWYYVPYTNANYIRRQAQKVKDANVLYSGPV